MGKKDLCGLLVSGGGLAGSTFDGGGTASWINGLVVSREGEEQGGGGKDKTQSSRTHPSPSDLPPPTRSQLVSAASQQCCQVVTVPSEG